MLPAAAFRALRHDPAMEDQLQSRLFRLPPELRLQIFGYLLAEEVSLSAPSDRRAYYDGYLTDARGLLGSCRRADAELVGTGKPMVQLIVPSYDGLSDTLPSIPPRVTAMIRRVVVDAPSWTIRPDRFQWSSDLPQGCEIAALGTFLRAASRLEHLSIRASGQDFPLLADNMLKQLKCLRVRQGVCVDVDVVGPKRIVHKQIMGPSPGCIEEVKCSIQGIN